LDKTTYHRYLIDSLDYSLYETEPESRNINPNYKSLEKWVTAYLGPATAEFHNISDKKYAALRDENRNAIIPHLNKEFDGKLFYLSVKGCGAQEDMFFGGKLTADKLKAACRDPSYFHLLKNIKSNSGFIMGESWMGESPYGAQGYINGFDELNFSSIGNLDSINGAHLCPAIGLVQLPKNIEKVAKKFFWCRAYDNHFYQVIRLVPSNIRLYFESTQVIANPKSIFSLFEINSVEKAESFELNFIKSGIALLTLYARSAKIEGKQISGIIYKDVWFDKDCVVAPDGIIHFADIEGFIWKNSSQEEYDKTIKEEWQKLVFEFLYALIKIDSYRHTLNERNLEWKIQREELALLIHHALNKDIFTYAENRNNNLLIIIEGDSLPSVEIPLIEMVN